MHPRDKTLLPKVVAAQLMHVKCIHESCIVLLIFQSYLHHIRVISLFYIDFGNISQFSYFSGINPAQAENPIFYILMFQGSKRRPKIMEKYRRQYFGRKKTWERRKQTNGGPRSKRGGPTRPGTVAAWDPPSWPSTLRCRRSFFQKLRLDLKPTIKIVPEALRRRAPHKHRNTETEIRSCRLEGENSGGALPERSPPPPTTTAPYP